MIALGCYFSQFQTHPTKGRCKLNMTQFVYLHKCSYSNFVKFTYTKIICTYMVCTYTAMVTNHKRKQLEFHYRHKPPISLQSFKSACVLLQNDNHTHPHKEEMHCSVHACQIPPHRGIFCCDLSWTCCSLDTPNTWTDKWNQLDSKSSKCSQDKL